MTNFHLDELDFILDQYGTGVFPFQMCPPSLFAEIIKINHLRMRAIKYEPNGIEDNLSQAAYRILIRIQEFSPEQWAESKPLSKQDWVLLGDAYRSAMFLYCISSLQSLSILPLNYSLRACCAAQGQHLQELLSPALSSPRTNRFMLWPLVLLGVESVNGGAAMRAFVGKQLSDLSYHLGSCVPLVAKGVLERFWASGETRWDACFDRPYAFSSQIAVDISQIRPLC